ncbi:MAG: hypothetical protein M2R45_04549 [Verrucomicrobia subdivision 3 bacterium]|nr:hypothetical protein [Limisphaerales bacterium]MCS1416812.1 hypothetical protein [Limisphaerales bacterium]
MSHLNVARKKWHIGESEWQQAVLFHEIGHIQRFDCLTQMVGQLLCAIFH